MPTISSTLRTMDGMSGPIARVIKQMNSLVASAEKLNRVMEGPSSGRNSLVPAKTNPDLQRMIGLEQVIIQLGQAMVAKFDDLTDEVSKINAGLSHTNKLLSQSAQQTQVVSQGLHQGATGANGMLAALKGAAAAYLSFQGVQAGMRVSDEYINSLARIELINDGLQTTKELQADIFAAADRSRGAYSDLAGVIGRMGILASDAFGSNQELVAFSELMQKSFRVGGASTMEQQAGMYQLSQAMAAGRLQGDEFRSIMENAPMLAQAIADFTGKSKGELKEMSAEGTITADIIKGAMFAAAEDIEEKFSTMPMTFGDIANQIGNYALQKFGTVIERINEMLNSSGGAQFIAGIESAINGAANAAMWLLTAFTNIYEFLSNNWSWIEPMFWGLATAIGGITLALTIYRGVLAATAIIQGIMGAAQMMATGATLSATAAQWGLNAALLANPMTWVVVGIIALVAAIVFLVKWLINLWKTNDEFAAGFLRAWNSILNFFDRLPGYFWQFVGWLMGPFEWWGKKVDEIYGDVINNIIKGINTVLGLVNSITGSSYELATEFSYENFAKNMKEYAAIKEDESFKNAAIKAAEREQKVLDFLDDRAARRAREEAVKGTEDSYGFDFSNFGAGMDIDSIKKVDEVDKVNKTVDISSEDLKVMRDLAEMQAIQNFVTLTPTVQVTTGPVSQQVDVDDMAARVTRVLEQEIESSARGVYNL